MNIKMKRFITNMSRSIYYLIMSVKYNCTRRDVNLSLTTKVKNRTKFEGPNKVGSHTFLSGEIGGYTYIGANCQLGRIKIGRFCSISPNVKVITANHPITYASTAPVFYSTASQCGTTFVDENIYDDTNYTKDGFSCEIGNDVWIGENVLIKGGIKIGDGAVIAMGAVVTKDIAPYTINGGVPAKVIKERFEDEEIKTALLDSKWWDENPDKLRRCAVYINSPIEFVKRIKEEK